jgi:hypothetical protein
VNAKDKCVSCHMPARLAFPNAPLTIKMADHFIRVNTPEEMKGL